MNTHHCPILFATVAAALVACGTTHDSDDKPAFPLTDVNRADEAVTLEGMVLHDVCGPPRQTACQSCVSRASRVQSECRANCNLAALITNQFAFSCADSCDDTSPDELCEYACDDADDVPLCEQRAYTFELTTSSNSKHLAACEAAVQRDEECERQTVETDCELFARVESADTIPVYNCFAERACDADPVVCLDLLPTGDLTTRLAAACESEIPESFSEFLELQQPWTSTELLDSALVCAERYCGTDAYVTCLMAWAEVVAPD
jgi:hypothetical protein